MTENRPVQASVGDEVSNGNQEEHPGLQVTETIAARPSSSPSSLDTQQEGPNDTEQRVPEGAIQASGEGSTGSKYTNQAETMFFYFSRNLLNGH